MKYDGPIRPERAGFKSKIFKEIGYHQSVLADIILKSRRHSIGSGTRFQGITIKNQDTPYSMLLPELFFPRRSDYAR